jgi:hypothetical protein
MSNVDNADANSSNADVSLQPQTHGYKTVDPETGKSLGFHNWDRKMKDGELYKKLSSLTVEEIIEAYVSGALKLERFELGQFDKSAGESLIARIKANISK